MAAIPRPSDAPLRPRVRPAPPAPRISAQGSGAATGVRRAMAPARPLPTGWGVVRRRLSRTMVVALALLAVASAGIFQVLQTSRIAEVGYALRDLETERESLDAQIRLLEARVADSSDLEHLRQQAVGRLGMVPSEDSLRIEVDTAAPDVVPLPRRYVQTPEHGVPPEASWWEELIGSIPGFD